MPYLLQETRTSPKPSTLEKRYPDFPRAAMLPRASSVGSMHMIDLNTHVSQSASPLVTEIEGEMVMMDVKSGLYFNLDTIGSDIWRRIAEPVSVLALCEAMERNYDADLMTIRKDVLELLAQMAEHGLVRTE